MFGEKKKNWKEQLSIDNTTTIIPNIGNASKCYDRKLMEKKQDCEKFGTSDLISSIKTSSSSLGPYRERILFFAAESTGGVFYNLNPESKVHQKVTLRLKSW